MRIASEYEATFGKRKLDLLIRDIVPDTDFAPGRLHKYLLQLPWADVFTTNYDTLLERTEVFGRTYQPVLKPSELTTAFLPRIIKLHGSLPSQTPFIASEEDYRTYPSNYAPFVNSVRQSLLENSFVLVGFSGDDPNFLQWSGWIRDELGDMHAPIYLVGSLALDGAKRRLLERRGITPIDMAPLFDKARYGERTHSLSTEWFLASLSAARPPRKVDWPSLKGRAPKATASLPPLVGAEEPPSDVPWSPRGSLTQDSVSALLLRWRTEREAYPGWLVAPEGKRSDLWVRSREWVEPLMAFMRNRSADERLMAFREITWRFNVIMAPLSSSLIEPFESVLDETRPDTAKEADRPLGSSTDSQDASVTTADAWFDVAFTLLQDSRESYDHIRWRRLKDAVDGLIVQHPAYSDAVQYEAALLAVWNIDHVSARAILSQWQPTPRSPVAGMHKASILAELGDLGEAAILLRSVLAEIRRALRSQGQNIELLSQEGWCAYLLSLVEPALRIGAIDEVRDEFAERWTELEASQCNPWSQIEYFRLALSAPPPTPPKVEEVTRGFDPGQASIRTHLMSGDLTPALPGFAYVRLFGQVGIPMRLQFFDVTGKALANACRWIAPFVVYWSPALLIRACKLEDLTSEDMLSRTRIRDMDLGIVIRTYNWSVEVLDREFGFLRGTLSITRAQETQLRVLVEVLSRLAFRLDSDTLARTFPLVRRLYLHPGVRHHPTLNGVCLLWFKRLFEAADADLLSLWLPELIRFPLTADGSSAIQQGVDLVSDVAFSFPQSRLGRESDLSATKHGAPIVDAVDWLLRRAQTEQVGERRDALRRLASVVFAMSERQKAEFGELLWAKADGNVPELPGFAVAAFLSLPAPPSVDVAGVVRNHLLATTPRNSINVDASGGKAITFGGDERSLVEEVTLASARGFDAVGRSRTGLEWPSEDSRLLFATTREWWSKEKLAVQLAAESPFPQFVSNSASGAAGWVGRFLAMAVLPNMDWATETTWQEMAAWISELRECGAFPSVALPYILVWQPAQSDSASKTLAEDIGSEAEVAVSSAAEAIRHWKHLVALNKVPPSTTDLVTALIQRVVFRRRAGIGGCIRNLSLLIMELPEEISQIQANLLTACLTPWERATALPVGQEGDGFLESERPELRTQIAMLGAALEKWHQRQNPYAPVPDEIGRLRACVESDSLPEIRRAFAVWDLIDEKAPPTESPEVGGQSNNAPIS